MHDTDKKREVGCIVQASFLGSNACHPFKKQRGLPQYLAYVIECMVHIDVSNNMQVLHIKLSNTNNTHIIESMYNTVSQCNVYGCKGKITGYRL